MVTTATRSPDSTLPLSDLGLWLSKQQDLRNRDSQDVLIKTINLLQTHLADLPEASQAEIIAIGIDTAQCLIDLGSDILTVATSLILEPVHRRYLALDQLEQHVGQEIMQLATDAGKVYVFDQIYQVEESQSAQALTVQQENLRRMFLALAKDIRVVLLILAARLVTMRQAKQQPQEIRVALARECMDVYAPLANRLGVGQLKWEMEDLAFRYIEPEVYRDIAKSLDEKRLAREQYIETFTSQLTGIMRELSISGEVTGRPKHIYSIWRKMQRKNLPFDQVFDVRAVRILVRSLEDCYAVLGIIHSRWKYIKEEFDDYIASPKGNNYQSLHTAIIGPEGKVVEVQIRTYNMHEDAELGVAAHWRYKENTGDDQDFDQKVNWFRQILEWRKDIADTDEFAALLKEESFNDRVFVLSPKGRIVDLPRGATPLDFAYAIHSDVGHRCRGAKINDKIVPLTTSLQSGQVVDIMTAKEGGPSRDWINPSRGFVTTSKARSKIQQWFNQQNLEHHVATGRGKLEKELDRLHLERTSLDKLSTQLKYDHPDKLFAALGRGEIKLGQVINTLQDELRSVEKPQLPITRTTRKRNSPKSNILIDGVGDLLVNYGRCCNPVFGDAIIGYITQAKGVTIHRHDCINAQRYRDKSPERILPVEWSDTNRGQYPVDVHVTAADRQGLIRDISSVFTNEKLNVISVNTYTDRKSNLAHMSFTLEIQDLTQLSHLLGLISQVSGVVNVQRRH